MEDFYGAHHGPQILEEKALLIHPEHRSQESRLMRLRWFDYRDWHPARATYFYAHCYGLQLRTFYARTVDERHAAEVRAFSPDDVFHSREATCFWLARGMADELGMPYPFVLHFAMERALERTQRTFPRPNQLYGEDLEIDLKAAWKDKLARQITYADGPYFKASAWRADLQQAQHLKFVVDQVKARPAPRHRLIARLIKEDVISPALARAQFGQEEADAAGAYLAQFS